MTMKPSSAFLAQFTATDALTHEDKVQALREFGISFQEAFFLADAAILRFKLDQAERLHDTFFGTRLRRDDENLLRVAREAIERLAMIPVDRTTQLSMKRGVILRLYSMKSMPDNLRDAIRADEDHLKSHRRRGKRRLAEGGAA